MTNKSQKNFPVSFHTAGRRKYFWSLLELYAYKTHWNKNHVYNITFIKGKTTAGA
ncbi:hypothetical protein KSF_072310 [Reticulibacter mediterranei]|uniref:Uncharacterized protein n=1 Tax=Reticulibacter mediterranei TaxID=2778369 RepID=A0A8J3IRD5_9CHLR|nr:hypothetical protein KSF_072310 [Reticulibacter mediterranei]